MSLSSNVCPTKAKKTDYSATLYRKYKKKDEFILSRVLMWSEYKLSDRIQIMFASFIFEAVKARGREAKNA